MAFSLEEKNYENSGPSRTAATDMGSISAELEALQGDFNSAFDGLDATVNMGDWDDPVQAKLQTYFTDVILKTAEIAKTSTDAALPAMSGLVSSLETQCNNLAGKQDDYVTLKVSEPPKKLQNIMMIKVLRLII